MLWVRRWRVGGEGTRGEVQEVQGIQAPKFVSGHCNSVYVGVGSHCSPACSRHSTGAVHKWRLEPGTSRTMKDNKTGDDECCCNNSLVMVACQFVGRWRFPVPGALMGWAGVKRV
ncbi:unnamed protein product [Choristocarpus tenellus]